MYCYIICILVLHSSPQECSICISSSVSVSIRIYTIRTSDILKIMTEIYREFGSGACLILSER